jgi:hypothetical protein
VAFPQRGLDAVGVEFSRDLVDEGEVHVEVLAQESDHNEEVLASVGEHGGGLFAVVEPLVEVGDVFPEGCEALARDRFSDEVANQ